VRLKKIDFYSHVVLHELEDTDFEFNILEMMQSAMAANKVKCLVNLPVSYIEHFQLLRDDH